MLTFKNTHLSQLQIPVSQIWSWGINDNASLGRQTAEVADPNSPGQFLDPEVFETVPSVIPTLADEEFRAVKIAAGDSVSVALGAKGEIRVWGSFRVRQIHIVGSSRTCP